MQDTEQKMMSIVHELRVTARDLPFEYEQGWLFSLHNMANYLHEHADNGTGFRSPNVAMMAAGRLDWLLKQTRPTLSELFNERDVIVLLDCYQGGIFFPDQLNCIASDLCDHLGIEFDACESSGVAPLLNKLRGLSSVQRMTLADVLEQTWYRCLKGEQENVGEFLASMDINLM